MSPGLSDLWVWKSDGGLEHRSVQVEKNTSLATGTSAALKQALGRLEEAEVLFSGTGASGKGEPQSAWRLRGEIRSEAEAGRIHALASGFPTQIIDETLPSPALLERAHANVARWLEASSYAQELRLELDTATASLTLRGSLRDPEKRRAIERKVRSIYAQIGFEVTALPDRAPVVHFKVYLLELKRTKLRTLGMDWGANRGGLRVSSAGIVSELGLASMIQAMEGDGSARVLSAPELVVRAPGEAELFSGGEIPVVTRTTRTSQVHWRPYGLLLKLNVTHATATQVRTDIQTEVSHLDAAVNIQDLPGIQANRMKTQVDATFGRPILLSGLLQEDVRRTARGLPFLKRLPVLGLLFGSEDFQEARSELVAILVPSVETPRPPLHRFARMRPEWALRPRSTPPLSPQPAQNTYPANETVPP